jgi:hypothetical protein
MRNDTIALIDEIFHEITLSVTVPVRNHVDLIGALRK